METVLLECILDNPYQPRTTDQAEHIENLARSIAADGLLQVPTARRVLTGAELAFGHSRRKAFEWLRMNWETNGLPDRFNGYSEMPLNFEDLSDEQMYRYAVTENVQRKDLDPIEAAKAMARYRDEFGKNSKEIGELFGMNDATVRGKLRLLDLPDEILQVISAGEVSEGTARTLLGMQKLGTTQDMLQALEEAKDYPEESPSYVVERFASNMSHVKTMWMDSRGGKPRSDWGERGWQLDMKKFPNHLLPALDKDIAVEALRLAGDEVAENLVRGLSFSDVIDEVNDEAVNVQTLQEFHPGVVERLRHLLNPPACSACPFYVKMDGEHLCGMKICHTRKLEAWSQQRMERMSKELGIRIYSDEDGKYKVLANSDASRALFDKKHHDLRILPKSAWGGHVYQSFTKFDSELGWLVATGEAIKKLSEKSEEEQEEETVLDVETEIENILIEAEAAIYWAAAEEVVKVFEGMSDQIITLLFASPYGWRHTSFPKGQEPTQEARKQSLWMARAMLGQVDTDVIEDAESAQQIVDALTQACKEGMGVKLPKSLNKLAAEFDERIRVAQAVSAETSKKGKRK